MRRRIRLTGRRQLSKSVVRVSLTELGEKPLVTMTLVSPDAFKQFPQNARVSLRLVENKRVEIVDLGTIGKMSSSRDLKSQGFVAPSCQLRIADPGTKAMGLLLASTDSWTLKKNDDRDQESSKGILLFLADDTAPQSWKLETRESGYPLVKVDKRIANAAMWARNDPIFVGAVLPSVVKQVFEEILRGEYSDDLPWVVDWLKWADSIMPGDHPPTDPEDREERQNYIERLLDSFCARHNLADQLLQATQPGDAQ